MIDDDHRVSFHWQYIMQ